MKATLHFDLEDPEDRIAHQRCAKALDMAIAISDILDQLRRWKDFLPEAETFDPDLVQRAILNVLSENRIDMEDLL